MYYGVVKMNFGFSYIGLIYFLMLMVPNIIWSKKYGKNVFLIISTIILGIGHIGIHLNHKKEAK